MGTKPKKINDKKLDKSGVKTAKAIAKGVKTAANVQQPLDGEILDPSADAGVQDGDQDDDAEKGLALLQQHKTLSLVGGVSTDDLRAALEVQTEQRALIKAFIKHHLEKGIDFGQIHVVKDCRDEKQSRGSCTKKYHLSKMTLFKPGQEKIFSLFSITDTIERDAETYEMLSGNTAGLIAYKCLLYRPGVEKPIGHGRGAATVGEQGRNVNSTIKIAEKRARMDACLSLGFSEYFVQDLDDPDYKVAAEQANERAAAEAARIDKDDLGLYKREDPNGPMDDDERVMLFRRIKQAGYNDPGAMLELLKANDMPDPQKITSVAARNFMRNLRDGVYHPVAVRAAAIDDTAQGDVNQDFDNLPATLETAATAAPVQPAQPELVVDDQLKEYVIDQYSVIALNGRGKMWLMKTIWGRPFAGFDRFTEKEWRKAYDVLDDILSMRLEVPDAYIKGAIVTPEPLPDVPPVDFSEPTNADDLPIVEQLP